jgi:hypothetical protein
VYHNSVNGTPGTAPALAALVIHVEKVAFATSAANVILCRCTRRRHGPLREATLTLHTFPPIDSQTRELPSPAATAQSVVEPAARSHSALAGSAHAARYALTRGAIDSVETRRAKACSAVCHEEQ